jgi:Transcriptional regulatory protein, C terminal
VSRPVPGMSGDGRLHFAVLGSFRVGRNGQEVDLGPRLRRALLAILVVNAGHVVPVDRLIGLLWREEPPAAAIASVQAYVSQLRRVLEPGRSARAPARVLVTQDPGYLEAAVLAQDASLDWHPAATRGIAAPADAVPGHAEAQLTQPQPAVAPSVPSLRALAEPELIHQLTHAGGVGKTRLALRAAAQAAPRFADGHGCVSWPRSATLPGSTTR